MISEKSLTCDKKSHRRSFSVIQTHNERQSYPSFSHKKQMTINYTLYCSRWRLPFICISFAFGSLNLHSHSLQLKLIVFPCSFFTSSIYSCPEIMLKKFINFFYNSMPSSIHNLQWILIMISQLIIWAVEAILKMLFREILVLSFKFQLNDHISNKIQLELLKKNII